MFDSVVHVDEAKKLTADFIDLDFVTEVAPYFFAGIFWNFF